MSNRLDVAVVREAARGHWDAIFCALAPAFKAAMQRPGKHVPCPVHGGKDGFRLFPDYEQAGSCVCNTCGAFRDGFAALEWLHGWGFAETLGNVARVLGLDPSCEEEVLKRAKKIERQGLHEIMLTGVNLTMYNHETGGLGELTERLLGELGPDMRIRFSSLEADHVDDRGSSKIMETDIRKPAAAPYPSRFDRVYEQADYYRVYAVRQKSRSFRHGAGNYRGRRSAEHKVEEKVG